MDGWIYVKFLSKVNLSPAGSRWFYLIGVHLDWRMLHCHLEVIAQQGHFGKKSRAQNGKKYGQRYYRTLIGSRMLFCPIESSSITLEHVSRSNHAACRRRHAPPPVKNFFWMFAASAARPPCTAVSCFVALEFPVSLWPRQSCSLHSTSDFLIHCWISIWITGVRCRLSVVLSVV